ncbi:MAG TPA: VWA domain-containing protein [Candidatus Angelobacter sp.]|jgi:VWFA-related protein|nr:VWA domain-containing protein [Candidatus Angelobacter sp.]
MPPLFSAKCSRLPLVSSVSVVLLFALNWLVLPGYMLGQSQPQPQATPDVQQQQNQQNTTPSAGGPEGDIGPIAVPKKKEEPTPKKEEAPKPPKKDEAMPNFSLKVNVPLVTLDVGVLTKDGVFVPGLKEQNFRVLEDGVPQKISGFNQTQAPITAVILMEFANNFYPFEYDSLYASSVFASTLKKEDWIALVTFDIREHILADFTQDKREIYEGLRSLQFAMSQESNLFDALYDTVDRLEGVEGRKYIILIASGRDTFSKHTLDQTLKKVQNSKDIAIYSVSTGQALREYLESHGGSNVLCPITSFSCRTEFLQADNQMKSFAKMTGGKYYAPLFQAQFREIFADIGQTIRNQYSLAYHPTNPAQDGSYRKIKVELVGPDGKPLKMRNEKGKDVKYQVVSREGYRARREVE